LRRLGANAARLVKGEPLALQDEYTFTSESKPATQIRKNEVLDKIAALVLANIRGDINEG
jgi:hypothetical protein